MLIFTYFHPIIGPDIILTAPSDLTKTIKPEYLDEIKNNFDNAEQGFFTFSAFGGDLRTANYFFMIKSEWARGREEMVMITKILQEADPNLAAYETELIKFSGRIKKEIPELYQVFYIRNPPKGCRDSIKQKLSILTEYMSDLYNELDLIKITTYGNMIPLNFFSEQRSIPIPARFISDFRSKSLEKKTENVFAVYQFRDGKIRIDLIPVKSEGILKVTLFFKNALSPDVIRVISAIFMKHQLSLIYTSGICASKQGKCIYEVYLDATYQPNRKELFSELIEIEKVDEVKIFLISS